MAKKKKLEEEVEMSFWDHLEELRWHIIRSVLAVIVLAVVAFLNRKIVFDLIILGPSTADFVTNRFLCYIGELFSIDGICIGDL